VQISELINSARFNVLLGKNGSGKSTILRALDAGDDFNTKYITPERGGTLKYDPGVDQNIANNVDWMTNDRRKNRADQFRQQSAAQFRNLEVLVLREIEQDLEKRQDTEYKFDTTIDKINDLLPEINIRRTERGFDLANNDDQEIPSENISSGESELIALAIEVLVFSRSTQENKVLLMDEPDVHLHPDSQEKFIAFVEAVAVEFNFKVVIATHSIAIIGAYSDGADLQIVPMTSRTQVEFECFKYDPICHEILPIFGSHPLSSQFNRTPVLLVEGEDDKRVIEQVMRSGDGEFRYSPCVVGTVTQMTRWERWLDSFLPSIYDNPQAFSLRDLDDAEQPDIEDMGCVSRTRLNCYAIENILLTNECLSQFDFTAEQFREKLVQWVDLNPTHQTAESIGALCENFDARRTVKIKDLRNVLLALLGTEKPWEVLVGQLIVNSIGNESADQNSLHTYLGDSVVNTLFK